MDSTTNCGRYLTGRHKPEDGIYTICRDHHISQYSLLKTAKQITEENEMAAIVAKEKEKTMKLFQIEGTDTFCTYLATNSEGKSVVEIKGSGEVKAVEHSKLVEVVPYTISVTSHSGQKQHLSAKKDFWQVNDVLPYNGNLYVVNKVDSRGGEGLAEVPNKKLAMVTE